MGDLVSLHPFVVHVAVSVEMIMISLQASLVFGPFANKDDALLFCEELEAAHSKHRTKEVERPAEIFKDTGLPAAPYLRVHLSECMVAEHPLARKEAKSLIPPRNPSDAEAKLGEYAIRAGSEALSYACYLLDKQTP